MGAIRNKLAGLIAGHPVGRANNSLGDSRLDFLRYGTTSMTPDWSQVILSDRDLYAGYMYAAIRKRANLVAQLATENVKTDASPAVVDAAKRKVTEVVHPYLELIDSSPTFSNYRFWYELATYLDLEGVYYLMAVRNVSGNRVGHVREFKLLSPYEVKPVYPTGSLELQGYRETRGVWQRDIPKELIIEIRDLNPFSRTEPYSLADAAKDSQFTLKQAGDYTRSSLRNNIKSSGIVSTGIEMTPEQLANFKARIMGGNKSEPVFTDGAGNVTWNPMQIELDKAALDKINGISLEAMMAVTGTSKTILGIEVSGVTRDTSKVQRDLFTSGEGMPRLQLINDALNQDYKVNYASEYKANRYRIFIDSPLGTDRDAELKDVEIRTKSHDLYVSLIDKGYDAQLAARYAQGEIGLDELGKPTPPDDADTASRDAGDADNAHVRHGHLPAIRNTLTPSEQLLLEGQASSLQEAVIGIEGRLVAAVANKVTRNAYDEQADIVEVADREAAEHELLAALVTFYVAVVPLFASMTISRRMAEFALTAEFTLTIEIREGIEKLSHKAAASHVSTVLDDLLATVREAALAGANQDELVRAIREKFQGISQNRAKTIAHTETNRAFSTAQYEADKQFLDQNDLTGSAYKKWVTRSPNPCSLCQSKAAEPPIPFEQAFAEVGDVVTATEEREDGTTVVRQLPITYETVHAGNLHVNCGCAYQLIIE